MVISFTSSYCFNCEIFDALPKKKELSFQWVGDGTIFA